MRIAYRPVATALGAVVGVLVIAVTLQPGGGLAAPASPTPTPGLTPRTPSPPRVIPGQAGTVVIVTLSTVAEVPPPKTETPRNAAGLGALVISADRSEVGFSITFSNLSGPASAAHVHQGAPGVAGDIVQTLCGPAPFAQPAPASPAAASPAPASPTPTGTPRATPAPSPTPGAQPAPPQAPALVGACPPGRSGTIAGVWRIPQAAMVDLLAGRLYVNVHTALNPAGEIRGQVR